MDDSVTMPDGYVLRTARYKEALYHGINGLAEVIAPDRDGGFTVIPYAAEVQDMGHLTNNESS